MNTWSKVLVTLLAKSQAIAKQHPEAELSLFENYSHFPSMLSPRNNGTCSKT